MALYELTIQQLYQAAGQEILMLNVMNFRDVSAGVQATGDVDALIDAIIADVMTNWVEALSVSVTVNQISARDLYDPTEFEERAVSLGGGVTADVMPPFVTARLRSERPAIGVHRKQLFFGGLGEAFCTGGELTTAGQTAIQEIGDDLSDIVTDPGAGGKTFRLVLLQKEKYQVPESSPPRYAYRYYQTLTEQVEHMFDITDLNALSDVTTMRSRRAGSGL